MLTDAKLRALKPSTRPFKCADAEGLFVLVKPNGSKLWRFSYRFQGKQKTLALGSYPQVSLLDARKKRAVAKEKLCAGQDPAHEKKMEKRRARIAAGNTFRIVAEEWFTSQKPRLAESYHSRLRTRLDGDLLPVLGERPIADIDPIEVLDAIRKIEARGAIVMAKRVMQMASAIFQYGVATARCRCDPTTDIAGALLPSPPAKSRKALKADQLPDFYRRLHSSGANPQTRIALELLILTLARTDEIRFAQWCEFEELEGKQPLWRISAERMKMEREHLVPLAPAAVRLLKELMPLAENSTFLFPSATRSGVMSENTMLFAMYRMGYQGTATVHGFRKTASTVLNEQQFNRDWVELQLSHAEGSVRSIYNAAEWLPGRRNMMCWWADYVVRARDKKRPVIAA
jgi:integrase